MEGIEPDPNVIKIRIVSRNRQSLRILVKKELEMLKVMEVYCDFIGTCPSIVRFFVRGRLIKATDTVTALGLAEGDQIVAQHLESRGL